MRKKFVFLVIFLILLGGAIFSHSFQNSLSLSSPPAHALEVGVNIVQQQIALPGTDIRILIAKIIRAALGLLGLGAVGIIIWGGFQWMTAGGEEDKITNAKRTIVNGVIGLAIILSAVAITQFVLNALIAATSGGPGAGGAGRFSGVTPRSGALGRGIIEMHYPERGATEVARNTNILITFKRPMKISSLIDGYDDGGTPSNLQDDQVSDRLNTKTVKIFKTAEGKERALAATEVKVKFTPDRKTFIFDPVDLLGSGSENVLYTVDLPGDGALLENNDLAFTGLDGGGYAWQFETGTFVDTIPPVVSDYFPFPSTRPSPPSPTPSYERNVLIQVNFNEAIDPTSLVNPGNLTVTSGGGAVDGLWIIANRYRSAEFVTTAACGANSCGETIYCLPANANIEVEVRAASLTADPDDGALAAAPYNGVADVAGNSLNDRGANAQAEGPPTDDVRFGFSTSGAIDITGPVIAAIAPVVLSGEVLPTAPVTVTFNEVMSRTSLSSESLSLTPVPDHELWYSLSSENLNQSGETVGPQDAPSSTRATVNHGMLIKAPVGTPAQGYVPAVQSTARDAYQNCFVPSTGPGPQANTTCAPNPYCCNGVPASQASCAGVGF